MLAALSAEGHAPGISGEPAVLFCRLTKDHGALAGREGMDIAFHTCRIDEKVPAGAPKKEEAVGMGDQAPAGAALKCLGSISTGSLSRVMVHDDTSRCTVRSTRCKVDDQSIVDMIFLNPAP